MNLWARCLVSAIVAIGTACDNGGTGLGDGGLDALDASVGIDSGVPGVSVEFGTGQSSFESLPVAGGHADLVYGAQGGYHVWGRAKFHGFAPDVDVSFLAVRLRDGAVLHMPAPALHRWIADGITRGLNDVGGGSFATDAELVILAIDCAADIVGERLSVRVFVRERATSRVASDEREFTVVRDLPSPPCPDR